MPSRAPGTPPARRPPPRAAGRTARRWRAGSAARGPAAAMRAKGVLAVALHPAEDLDGSGDGSDRPGRTRDASSGAGAREAIALPIAEVTRSGPTRCVPQRSCSLAALAAVAFVGTDGDVLGAVVGREVGPRRAITAGASDMRPARNSRAPGSIRVEPRTTRTVVALASMVASTAAARTGIAPPAARDERREQRERFGEAQRPAQERRLNAGRELRLGAGRRLQRAVRQAHRAAPRRRAVDEHAVLQCHAAQADLSRPFRVRVPARYRLGRASTRRRSAAWSFTGGRPTSDGTPSSSMIGISSRTDDDVNASSALLSSSIGYEPSSTAQRPAASSITAARVTPARMPSSSDGVKSVEVPPPPHVRDRALEDDAVTVDEDGIVRASTTSFRLGGHVDRVARRLDAGQQPRDIRADAEEADDAQATHAHRLELRRQNAHQRQSDRRTALPNRASRPVAGPHRVHAPAPERGRPDGRLVQVSTGGTPIAATDRASRSRCACSPKGRPP